MRQKLSYHDALLKVLGFGGIRISVIEAGVV